MQYNLKITDTDNPYKQTPRTLHTQTQSQEYAPRHQKNISKKLFVVTNVYSRFVTVQLGLYLYI